MRSAGVHLACGVAATLAGCSLFSLDSLQDFDGAGGATAASGSAAIATTGSSSASSGGSTTTGSTSGSTSGPASTSTQSGSGGDPGAGGGTGSGGEGGSRSTPYADAVLADGPIAYLHLDEPAIATTAVDSVGDSDGAIVGGVIREQPGAVADDGGRAMRFDGASGALVLGDVHDFPDGAPFSIELWAKRAAGSAFPNLEWIFSKEVGLGGDRQGYCLLMSPELEVGAEVWFGSSDAAVAYDHDPVALDAWHHMVVTGDASSLLLFVDGVQHNDGGYTTGLADTIGDLIFGAQAGQQNNFDGWLDEIAIYDVQLGSTQIAQHLAAAGGR